VAGNDGCRFDRRAALIVFAGSLAARRCGCSRGAGYLLLAAADRGRVRGTGGTSRAGELACRHPGFVCSARFSSRARSIQLAPRSDRKFSARQGFEPRCGDWTSLAMISKSGGSSMADETGCRALRWSSRRKIDYAWVAGRRPGIRRGPELINTGCGANDDHARRSRCSARGARIRKNRRAIRFCSPPSEAIAPATGIHAGRTELTG